MKKLDFFEQYQTYAKKCTRLQIQINALTALQFVEAGLATIYFSPNRIVSAIGGTLMLIGVLFMGITLMHWWDEKK